MARSPDDPISILRAVPNCRWCYRYSKLSPQLRQRFFLSCLEKVEGDDEESENWRRLFKMLATTSREELLAAVNGDSAMLYHAFSWRWFCDYQKEAQRKRRARHKEESLIEE